MPILTRIFTPRSGQASALAFLWLVFQASAQSLGTNSDLAMLSSNGNRAPLVLFISGSGRVLPFHDGQLLEIGPEYRMQAIPERGSVFAGWNRLNVFTFNIWTVDGSGNPTNVISTDVSPVQGSLRSPILRFTVQSSNVLEEIPGLLTISETTGWQANFTRR